MSDATFAICFAALVFLVPASLYVFANYEAPGTFDDAWRRCGTGALIVFSLQLGLNFGHAGLAVGQWDWGLLLGIPISGAIAMLAINWLILRVSKRRENAQ